MIRPEANEALETVEATAKIGETTVQLALEPAISFVRRFAQLDVEGHSLMHFKWRIEAGRPLRLRQHPLLGRALPRPSPAHRRHADGSPDHAQLIIGSRRGLRADCKRRLNADSAMVRAPRRERRL